MTALAIVPTFLGLPGWIAWIVIGLIAGAISSRIVRGRGMGCILDIVVGVVGAVVAGFLLSLLAPGTVVTGFWLPLIAAIVGAVILLAVVRLLTGGRRRGP
jgi:uncharacterized membrane protein YeaQ/YmgE (transglycosylase-associated protein family)